MKKSQQQQNFQQQANLFQRKRQKYSKSIRENDRQQKFRKHRNINLSESKQENANMISQLEQINQQYTPDELNKFIIDNNLRQQIIQINMQQYSPEMLKSCIEKTFKDQDPIEMHRGVIGIRKIMTGMKQPPIQKLIDIGMLKQFVYFMNQNKYPQLKLQAAWSLANLTTGNLQICKLIVDKGGAQAFIKILRNPQNHKILVQQAIIGIGNIGTQCKYRDNLIKQGALDTLITLAQNTIDAKIVRNCCWALTNLCRGFPQPEYRVVKKALPILCKAIKNQIFDKESINIAIDCCWTINFLTESSKEKVHRFLQQDCLKCFFNLALSENKKLSIPSLRIIGNVSAGTSSHTAKLIEHNIFDVAMQLLSHPVKQMRRQICWILSNIAGSPKHTSLLIRRRDIIQKVLSNFEKQTEQVQKQICWIFATLIYSEDPAEAMQIFLQYEIVRYFVFLLDSNEEDIIQNIIQCFEMILTFGEKNKVQNDNIILSSLLRYGGAEKLQKLQSHPSKKIYKKVAQLCKKYSEDTTMENDMVL